MLLVLIFLGFYKKIVKHPKTPLTIHPEFLNWLLKWAKNQKKDFSGGFAKFRIQSKKFKNELKNSFGKKFGSLFIIFTSFFNEKYTDIF